MIRSCSSPLLRFAGRVLVLSWFLLAAGVSASQAPVVVVSIKPLHSLFDGLMQGVAEPQLLIDGRTPAWAHQPDSAQRAAIADADILVWSGAELEAGLAEAIAARGNDRITFEVLASDVLKVLPAPHEPELRDPMYWLDSRNMLLLLDVFAGLLIEADPARATAYERNWQRMIETLSTLDRVMEYGYRDVSGVAVFFYHDTHQYFAQAYAMHMAAAANRIGAEEPGDAEQLLETRAAMQAAGDSCLFVEHGLDEPHLDLLTEGLSVTVVELDSFGAGLSPGADLYADLMKANYAAISGCVRSLKPRGDETHAERAGPDVSRSPDRLMPRYLMMDQYGQTVSNHDFRGKLQVIYFGYTFCPDICPTSLAVMAQALQLLGEDAEQIQPIFITVDPERDTPELLAEYVKYFHPRMLGLSANPKVTKRVAELFRARYERVPAEDGDPRRYIVDHTASLFVLGRNGEFLTKFAHGLPARDVADRLRELLQR